MNPELITYIQSLSVMQLIRAFDKALQAGKVERSDWYTWQKVWSEGRELGVQANQVFTEEKI